MSLAEPSLEELVALSIGSNAGWWGSRDLGNKLAALQKGKLSADVIAEYERELRKSLAWLKEDGLVVAIDVKVERSGRNAASYAIELELPDGSFEVLEGMYGNN